jgi:hypothetical protein
MMRDVRKNLFAPVCTLLLLWISVAPSGSNGFDWSEGNWGIQVTNTGTPGSSPCTVYYPGGSKSGNALMVYYRVSDTDTPQFWVFLTDGFWRQVAYGNPFGTSFRVFQYYSSGDDHCDRASATSFHVMGTVAGNRLEIQLNYENNAPAGDRFEISAGVFLQPPSRATTAMEASLTVTNVTGHDITPYWDGHRELAEQWVLFGVSSMYVADNLTDEIPAWYDLLDPGHDYVGITNDSDYLNDGFSQNGQIHVSTHDVKYVVAGSTKVSFDHEACPYIIVPGYSWYEELVMLDQVSRRIGLKHRYASGRNHLVELRHCSGMTSETSNLKWSVTYNRNDANLVDGDNIQVKLGMDDFLNTWPDGVSQTIQLRMRTGRVSAVLPGSVMGLLLE